MQPFIDQGSHSAGGAVATGSGTTINQEFIDANHNHFGQPLPLPWPLAKVLAAEIKQVGNDLWLENGEETLVISNWVQNQHISAFTTSDGQEISAELLAGFTSISDKLLAGPGTEVQVASIKELTGEAWSIDSSGNRVQLRADDVIVEGSVIETEGDGRLNLLFLDGSELDIGPNSRVAVNEFSYDSTSQSGFSFLSVLKGIFSFSSGLIARDNPENIKFATPISEIGIRGTTFVVKVDENGEVELVLLEGRISFNAFGETTNLFEPFSGAKLTPAGVQVLEFSSASLITTFGELYQSASNWQQLLDKADQSQVPAPVEQEEIIIDAPEASQVPTPAADPVIPESVRTVDNNLDSLAIANLVLTDTEDAVEPPVAFVPPIVTAANVLQIPILTDTGGYEAKKDGQPDGSNEASGEDASATPSRVISVKENVATFVELNLKDNVHTLIEGNGFATNLGIRIIVDDVSVTKSVETYTINLADHLTIDKLDLSGTATKPTHTLTIELRNTDIENLVINLDGLIDKTNGTNYAKELLSSTESVFEIKLSGNTNNLEKIYFESKIIGDRTSVTLDSDGNIIDIKDHIFPLRGEQEDSYVSIISLYGGRVEFIFTDQIS